MNLSDHFHCYVITLKGWEERLKRFHDRTRELGVTGFEVVRGIDGRFVPIPSWWKHNKGQYGCNLSHEVALRRGLQAGEKPIMIFEDDAFLRDDFVLGACEAALYFQTEPDSSVLYLGGKTKVSSTVRVSPGIIRPVSVIGTYAYIVSQAYTPTVLKEIMGGLNDVQLRLRGVEDEHAIFLPVCVGHHGGKSTIRRRERKDQHCGPLKRTE